MCEHEIEEMINILEFYIDEYKMSMLFSVFFDNVFRIKEAK